MPSKSKSRSSSSRSKSSSGSRSSSRSTQKDAIAVLKEDHEKVRKLFKQLEGAATKDAGRSEKLLQQIEMELKVHTTIEEEIFYPAYHEAIEGREKDEKLFYEAHEEHHVVDMVMPEVKQEEAGTPQFAAKAKVLKDLVEHHAEEEESEMFPRARKAIGAAELRELGLRLTQRKNQLMR